MGGALNKDGVVLLWVYGSHSSRLHPKTRSRGQGTEVALGQRM